MTLFHQLLTVATPKNSCNRRNSNCQSPIYFLLFSSLLSSPLLSSPLLFPSLLFPPSLFRFVVILFSLFFLGFLVKNSKLSRDASSIFFWHSHSNNDGVTLVSEPAAVAAHLLTAMPQPDVGFNPGNEKKEKKTGNRIETAKQDEEETKQVDEPREQGATIKGRRRRSSSSSISRESPIVKQSNWCLLSLSRVPLACPFSKPSSSDIRAQNERRPAEESDCWRGPEPAVDGADGLTSSSPTPWCDPKRIG